MFGNTTYRMTGISAAAITAAAAAFWAPGTNVEASTVQQDTVLFVDTVLDFHRGTNAGNLRVQDPNAALGAPDHVGQSAGTSVSLGTGGWITLGFSGENYLTVSGNDDVDLLIWDAGAIHELATVYVRPLDQMLDLLAGFSFDDDGFIEVGLTRTDSGLTGIDLDTVFGGFAFGELLFDAVKILDSELFYGLTNDAAGLDLDAVGAASFARWEPAMAFLPFSNPVATPSPTAAVAGLALLLTLGVRRRSRSDA